MKKLRMIVISVVVLAIVGSAFAFNEKKIWRFCYSSVFDGDCVISSPGLKKVPAAGGTKRYYVACWYGETCTSTSPCTEPADFSTD